MSKRQSFPWRALFITLLATVLRLYQLGAPSFWFDEAFTVVVTRLPLRESLGQILTLGAYSPFFYLLLKPITAVLGQSEFAYRFLSASLGILSVPMLYRVACHWLGRNTGWLAALLLAIDPFHLWYSQDARMYAMMGLFALAAMDQFDRLLRGGKWLPFIVLSALAYLSHYAALFMIYVQLVCLLPRLQDTQLFRRWFASQVAALLPLLPWGILYIVTTWETRALGIGWIPRPDWLTLPRTLWNMSSGDTDTWTVGTISLSLLLGVILARGAWLEWRANRFLLWWLFLPIVTNLLVSLRQPLYADRYFMASLPAYILLLTRGIVGWPSRWLRTGAALIVIGILCWGTSRIVGRDPYFAKEDWRGATAIVEKELGQGDHVLFQDYEALIGTLAYRTRPWPFTVLQPDESTAALEEQAASHQRIWLISRSPYESNHRLAKSATFDVYSAAPSVRAWLTAHRSQIALDLRLPGLSVVRVDTEKR